MDAIFAMLPEPLGPHGFVSRLNLYGLLGAVLSLVAWLLSCISANRTDWIEAVQNNGWNYDRGLFRECESFEDNSGVLTEDCSRIAKDDAVHAAQFFGVLACLLGSLAALAALAGQAMAYTSPRPIVSQLLKLAAVLNAVCFFCAMLVVATYRGHEKDFVKNPGNHSLLTASFDAGLYQMVTAFILYLLAAPLLALSTMFATAAVAADGTQQALGIVGQGFAAEGAAAPAFSGTSTSSAGRSSGYQNLE